MSIQEYTPKADLIIFAGIFGLGFTLGWLKAEHPNSIDKTNQKGE